MALKRAVWLAVALCAACSKPEEKPRRTEPWLAEPSASVVATTAPRRFRFAKDSTVRFSTPGKKGTVSGRFAVTQGHLELDPQEPKNTRASLEVDLTTLVIDTEVPPEVELGASAATIALRWLELGDRVPAERRSQLKVARFELSSLEGAGVEQLSQRRRASGTRVTAVGTLLLHGFRTPVRADLLVAGGGSERLSIRTTNALVVPLSTHDITARDASGIADALGAARAASFVGKNARVELELFAEPEPAGNSP